MRIVKNFVATKELVKAEKAILWCIIYHVGDNKCSFVSHRRLAEETGYCRQSVMDVVDRLEEKKWLIVNRRQYTTFEYFLPDDKFGTFSPNAKSVDTPMSKSLTKVDNRINTGMSTSLTGGCNLQLHKEIITKNKTKLENQDGDSADESATSNTPAKTQTPVEEISLHKTTTVFALQEIWKVETPKAYPEFQGVDFTHKQRGQVKNMIERVGSDIAAEVFKQLIINWKDFGYYLGHPDWHPHFPLIGMFTKHAIEAKAFYLLSLKRDDDDISKLFISPFK